MPYIDLLVTQMHPLEVSKQSTIIAIKKVQFKVKKDSKQFHVNSNLKNVETEG